MGEARGNHFFFIFPPYISASSFFHVRDVSLITDADRVPGTWALDSERRRFRSRSVIQPKGYIAVYFSGPTVVNDVNASPARTKPPGLFLCGGVKILE